MIIHEENKVVKRFLETEIVIPDTDDISIIVKECDIYAPNCNLPALGLHLIDTLDNASRKYVLYLNNINVSNRKFFAQIQWLITQNNYLDVLKHKDVWIAFSSDNVKVKSNKDYWSMNLRPNHYFDDATWEYNDGR